MFSKSCEYGIRATLFIISEYYKGNKPGIKEISNQINSPEAFTAKILQILVKHEIINSTKGPSGGFSVKKEHISNIKLLDIVKAIDGDSIYEGCILGLPKCSEHSPCPVHNKFKPIRKQLKDMLTSISVQELAMNINKGITFLKYKELI